MEHLCVVVIDNIIAQDGTFVENFNSVLFAMYNYKFAMHYLALNGINFRRTLSCVCIYKIIIFFQTYNDDKYPAICHSASMQTLIQNQRYIHASVQ